MKLRSKGTSSNVGSAMLSQHASKQVATSLDLSGREMEIIRGLFDNMTEKAIAALLGLSAHTVHTHVGRLSLKLRVTSRTQLVLRIVRQMVILTASATTRLPPRRGHFAPGGCKPGP